MRLEWSLAQHEVEVTSALDARQAREAARLAEARASGTLVECECCFDDEVLPEEVEYSSIVVQ
jgi:hypothetical protein